MPEVVGASSGIYWDGETDERFESATPNAGVCWSWWWICFRSGLIWPRIAITSHLFSKTASGGNSGMRIWTLLMFQVGLKEGEGKFALVTTRDFVGMLIGIAGTKAFGVHQT